MNRPFLFLAGEFNVTQALVFKREAWQHTMTGRRLVREPDGRLHRDNIPGESLWGFLWYASVDDEALRRRNLRTLRDEGTPCWPNPAHLLELDDRHEVMRRCMAAGLATDDVHVLSDPELLVVLEHNGMIERPYVVKTGNLHRGEGKLLVGSDVPTPQWEGTATIERFYEGVSCRALWIGDDVFTIRYDNPDSWIKNAAGAELEPWGDMPGEVIAHSRKVHEAFGLDISGIDYIVGADGFHFLEYNQFPGLGPTDEAAAAASALLSRKMTLVEQWAEAVRK